MVFLTSIDILDTGFLTVSNRTGQLSTANRVNSGSALRLKGVQIEIGTSANIDDETYSGEFDDIECPLISSNADTIKLTLYLNKSATASSTGVWGTGDMKYLLALSQLPKTKGFKALYYPVPRTAVTTRNNNHQVSYYLGRTDTVQIQGDIDITLANTADSGSSSGYDLTDVNYIPVRFKSCTIRQEPGNTVSVTLDGVRTA